jgi:hypothetical protein
VRIGGSTYTVAQILNLMGSGNTFYTVGPRSNVRADVIAAQCPSQHETIKTVGDETKDNNLVNLPC